MATVLALCDGGCDAPVRTAGHGPDVVLVGCGPGGSEDTCPTWPPARLAKCESGMPGDPTTGMPLLLWVPGEWRTIDAWVDDKITYARRIELEGGQRLELAVPPGARSFAISLDGTVRHSWTVIESPPEPEAVVAARAALALPAGDPGREMATHRLRAEELDPTSSLARHDILADLAFQDATALEGDARRAAWKDALRVTDAAFVAESSAGEAARARCHARRGLYVALVQLADLEAARAWLARVEGATDPAAYDAFHDAHARGLFAQRVGDTRQAIADFTAATLGARRWGDRAQEIASQKQLAVVYASTGRDRTASDLLARTIDAAAEQSCREWLNLLNADGWARFRLTELGREVGDPIARFETVRLVLANRDDEHCADPLLNEHVTLNLALAAAQAGWSGYAEMLLEELPAREDAAGDTGFWREELERRLALARGDRGELVELLMLRDVRAWSTPEERWATSWWRGQAFETLGLADDALREYADAEEALDEQLLHLDFDGGRDRMLAGHTRSAARMLELLLARGQVELALCVAREARRRSGAVLDRVARIASLAPDARRRWSEAILAYERVRSEFDELLERAWQTPMRERPMMQAALADCERRRRQAAVRALALLTEGATADVDSRCAELPDPAEGELDILLFPIDPGRRVAVFGWASEGPTSGFVADAPPRADDLSAWSSAVIEPLAREIGRAGRLTFMPTGASWQIPFAALPLHGDALLASVPIALGLDLDRPHRTSSFQRRALVVADPVGDLPLAAVEASDVSEQLARGDWTVERRIGAESDATRTRALLAEVDLLHYAGHGEHDAESWTSVLRLGRGASLGVEDVLALPRVPRFVALPACDSASAGSSTATGDMSVARAFLLAGSDVVIGSSGTLDDRLAAAVSRALYRRPEFEPVAALRDALLVARDDPDLPIEVRASWSSMVALVR